MPQQTNDIEQLGRRLSLLTWRKGAALLVLGLACPLYFVNASPHFRPTQWGLAFWLVTGMLWMVGVFGLGVAYLSLGYLAHLAKRKKQ
jgi:hypothetical protein